MISLPKSLPGAEISTSSSDARSSTGTSSMAGSSDAMVWANAEGDNSAVVSKRLEINEARFFIGIFPCHIYKMGWQSV